jgi:predicted XRE-type DNA-binding protein
MSNRRFTSVWDAIEDTPEEAEQINQFRDKTPVDPMRFE